jgi:hypothetical protein
MPTRDTRCSSKHRLTSRRFPLAEMRPRKCSSAGLSIPTWYGRAIASGTTFIGVGKTLVGDQSVRSGAQLAVAGQDHGADIKGRTNQAFFSKVSYTAPGTPLAGYPLRSLAPVSRDESVVRAIQRPGVRP